MSTRFSSANQRVQLLHNKLEILKMQVWNIGYWQLFLENLCVNPIITSNISEVPCGDSCDGLFAIIILPVIQSGLTTFLSHTLVSNIIDKVTPFQVEKDLYNYLNVV